MTSYAITILEPAKDIIDALPEKDRRVIVDAIRIIQAMPRREGTRLTDELTGYRRLKKGRHRIFYEIDETRHLVRILFIGLRKAGDRHDAYREFQRHFGGRP